jgi:hypothetical protein
MFRAPALKRDKRCENDDKSGRKLKEKGRPSNVREDEGEGVAGGCAEAFSPDGGPDQGVLVDLV